MNDALHAIDGPFKRTIARLRGKHSTASSTPPYSTPLDPTIPLPRVTLVQPGSAAPHELHNVKTYKVLILSPSESLKSDFAEKLVKIYFGEDVLFDTGFDDDYTSPPLRINPRRASEGLLDELYVYADRKRKGKPSWWEYYKTLKDDVVRVYITHDPSDGLFHAPGTKEDYTITADSIVAVCDVCDRTGFNQLQTMMRYVCKRRGQNLEDLPLVVVGCNNHRRTGREVGEREAEGVWEGRWREVGEGAEGVLEDAVGRAWRGVVIKNMKSRA